MEIETMPYFPISSGEYKAFRSKLSDAEFLQVIDKLSDVACFGFSNIELENPFQVTFFNKSMLLYEKSLNKYKSSVNNGKKGGRPRKSEGGEPPDLKPITPRPIYDITCNPNIDKCFVIYNEICKDLKPVRYERRSRDILELVAQYLEETSFDFEYFKEVCAKANEQKTLCNNALDFKGVVKNHIAICNEKFKKAETGKVVSKLKFK